MIKTNKFIIIIYILCILCFSLQLKQLGMNCMDIPFYSRDILYFYFFAIHFLIILLKYGYYQNSLSKYLIYRIIRYKKKIKIYHLFLFECMTLSLILTLSKVFIEYLIFQNIQNIFSYFLFVLFILIIHFYLEILISKQLSLIFTGFYLAIALTLGDLLYECHFQSFIFLWIPNLIMPSRIEGELVILIMIVVVYIVGLYMIKKKEFI